METESAKWKLCSQYKMQEKTSKNKLYVVKTVWEGLA